MGICSPIENKLSKHQNHQIHQIQQIQNNLNGKITNIKLETEKKKENKNDMAPKPVSARSTRLWLNTPVIVATSARLWITRLSATTAKFTATNRRCGTE